MAVFSEFLADYVLGYSLDSFDSRVREQAKVFSRDGFGCMLAGSAEPAAHIITNFCARHYARPDASVYGDRAVKLEVGAAAMCNAVAAHVHDYDDVSASATGHPSVVVMPAALALGEKLGSGGKEVLEAYALGVEVMALMGRALNPEHYSRGWHNTATLGIFGATAAAGRLLSLDREQLINAFGIAASCASGLKGNFGTMTKPLHAGLAASKGIFAAELAGYGYEANRDIFEISGGFIQVTTGTPDVSRATEFAARHGSEFLEPGMEMKPFPSCKATHNGISAAMELKKSMDFHPEDIAEIKVLCQPIAKDLLKYPAPDTPTQGKFSMNYCIACAMVYGSPRLEHFQGNAIEDERVKALMSRIDMEVCPEIAGGDYFNGTWETWVRVTLKDGRTGEKKVRYAPGDPENPLSRAQMDEKFRECASIVMLPAYVERVSQALERLDELENITELSGLVNQGTR